MTARSWALAVLAALLLATLAAELTPHHAYEEQFRESIDAPASATFWLGTDGLGRDRWSRLIYGTRVSLLLAFSAAALSVALAAAAGAGAGFLGGASSAGLLSAADMFLSIPWFFLLTAVRAALPLNTGPLVSVLITFALLGVLGWAGPARVISLRTREILGSDYVRQARAMGMPRMRLFLTQVLPNLRPLVAAQFWILVPAYIVAEANLGVLGLGVSEPLPSWGSLLRELESAASWGSMRLMLPMLLLAMVTGSMQLACRRSR